MIWLFVDSIVMGAVHDFGALIISMRNQGKSISEYTAKYVNNRTKIFIFLIIFLELCIVIAIFGLVIAVVFSMYPTSVLPVWLEIPIAVYLGYLIYRKGANVMAWSIIAVAVMYATVVIGAYVPIKLPVIAGFPPTGVWMDHHIAGICLHRFDPAGNDPAAAPRFHQLAPVDGGPGVAVSGCSFYGV